LRKRARRAKPRKASASPDVAIGLVADPTVTLYAGHFVVHKSSAASLQRLTNPGDVG
jgi:hypothetical protein